MDDRSFAIFFNNEPASWEMWGFLRTEPYLQLKWLQDKLSSCKRELDHEEEMFYIRFEVKGDRLHDYGSNGVDSLSHGFSLVSEFSSTHFDCLDDGCLAWATDRDNDKTWSDIQAYLMMLAGVAGPPVTHLRKVPFNKFHSAALPLP